MALADTETRQGSAGEDTTPSGTDWGSYQSPQSGPHGDSYSGPGLYNWRADIDTFDYSSYNISGIYQNEYVLSQLAKQEALEAMPDVLYDNAGYGYTSGRPQGPGITPYMGEAYDPRAGVHYNWVIDKDVRAQFLEQEASTLKDTFDAGAFNRRAAAFGYDYNPFGDSSDAAIALQTWENTVFNQNETAAQREYNSLRFAQLEGSEEFAKDTVAQYKLWRYEDRLVRTRDRAEALEQAGDTEGAEQLRQAGMIGTGEQWDVLSDPALSTTIHVGVGATAPAQTSVQLGRESSVSRAARARGKKRFESSNRAQL